MNKLVLGVELIFLCIYQVQKIYIRRFLKYFTYYLTFNTDNT